MQNEIPGMALPFRSGRFPVGATMARTHLTAQDLRCAVVVAHKKSMDVRPELFHLETDGVPPDLCSPNIGTAPERPGAGMVCIGDGCGRATSEDFGEVELSLTRVRAGDQNPQASVRDPVEKPSFSQLVVPRVLSQHRREDGGGHEVLDRVVGKRQGVAFTIAFKPLPEGGVRVASLVDSCFEAEEREFEGVKRPLRHQLEFLLGRKRRQ